MKKPDREGALELDQDLGYQSRESLAARVLWVVLLGIMVATGLGVFGGGVLSRVRAGSPAEGLQIEYERFGRFGAPLRLVVHARASASDRLLRVTLSAEYLEAMQVLSVTPLPESTVPSPEGVQYAFTPEPGRHVALHFTVQPIRRWSVRGTVRGADTRLAVRQFIYP